MTSQPGQTGPEVLQHKAYGGRTFILNRPKALNALNLAMVRAMTPQLQAWDQSDLCKVIMIKSDHPKAFCSGGDTNGSCLTTAMMMWIAVIEKAKEQDVDALTFFKEEYQLNHLIATLMKPYVALINGYTMGGGVGLSVHAPFRVATEKTVFAMPETIIGFFPDVGGTFFLPRMDGETGTYLALTGHRLSGEDVIYAGIATHYVLSHRLPALEERLNELESEDLEVINMAIEEFSAEPTKATYSLGPHRAAIDRCFKFNTIHEIFAALEKEGGEWAGKTLATLRQMSPTSLQVTLSQLRAGREMTIGEALKAEYALMDADFYEGVTARLVEKREPRWSPATVEELDLESIKQRYFNDQASSTLELLTKRDYAQYPYARHTLPSEEDVRQLVLGHSAGASNVRMSAHDIVSILGREWSGRMFVRERVEEIIARCCSQDKGEGITWSAPI
ncbi:ClpP/crotonase-like domain-containing protein [Syncephalis pseudoplumigaleata]|uniref:3-hydroxyisobutyryl-CoA hydrolase n=1 Tax=Syncephalis pseudoplumigaleata TaxID=1712513 RepID=A0A4P9YZK0_9FUNG|nr:ClpP/crotonase-like domain-containing protein [Syncephalis pseudoplumigaleata]|eukprot:RKP25597.1 ClpP/crotonase-like domain-containing protein [Syncephalis pseudoplumigaleata]